MKSECEDNECACCQLWAMLEGCGVTCSCQGTRERHREKIPTSSSQSQICLKLWVWVLDRFYFHFWRSVLFCSALSCCHVALLTRKIHSGGNKSSVSSVWDWTVIPCPIVVCSSEAKVELLSAKTEQGQSEWAFMLLPGGRHRPVKPSTCKRVLPKVSSVLRSL